MVQLLYILYLGQCILFGIVKKQSTKFCNAIEAGPLCIANRTKC